MSERDRGLHRHGAPDPKDWDERPTFAERPNKEPQPNTTLAERAAARSGGKAPEPPVKAEPEAEVTDDDEDVSASLVSLGGGWYETPDGERHRGQDAALAHLAAAD